MFWFTANKIVKYFFENNLKSNEKNQMIKDEK